MLGFGICDLVYYTLYMDNCIFCKIIKGEIPCTKIHEDENTLAFLDINPINKGHTLIIPKSHHQNLYEIPDILLGEIMSKTKGIAKTVKKVLGADGINIGQNNETAAGQVVFHYHVHIIPRFDNDGLKHWPGHPYLEGEAEEIAEKIKSAL